jgi:hypothetical protein
MSLEIDHVVTVGDCGRHLAGASRRYHWSMLASTRGSGIRPWGIEVVIRVALLRA